MVRVSSATSISDLGKFLRDSGYDVAHLGHELELGDGLYAKHENLEPLLAKTEGQSVLAVLARLFFVCWPVDEARCITHLPHWFLQASLDCGLLEREGNSLVSTACVFPFRASLIACDSSRTRTTQTDMVTGPSASSQYPARLAVRGENETTLDLGTGTGALAFEVAKYSTRVIGTDINPRCLAYAEFNAAFNNVTNVEWRCGDAFEPVAGQRFSRIVANPPFFLSPANTFVYCDSPLELDGFTARLARECSTYLEEGGFYQMICEWVEIEGESWEQRLRDWTARSGCDVLVLLAPHLTPIGYAEKRTQEASLMQVNAMEYSFTDRLHYLRGRKVASVRAGVISMRKRSGAANWFSMVKTDPVGDVIGDDVKARFDALTFLAASTHIEIFSSRLKLAPDVVFDRRAHVGGNGGWQTTKAELVKLNGLVDRLGLDETVGEFLPLFNGQRTVAEIAAMVAQRLQVGIEDGQQRCLTLARRLIQTNLVTW